MIPIILLTHNRPIQFVDCIESIEKHTDMNNVKIIVCDNGSTQPEMVSALSDVSKRHEVIYNGSNMLFKGFNSGLSRVEGDYFILTDPDILLQEDIPKDWPNLLINILNERRDVPKVGLALYEGYDPSTRLIRMIKQCEKHSWDKQTNVNSVPDHCYHAATDTTMCMYRRDTYEFWKDGKLLFDEEHGIVPLNYITQDHYNSKYPSLPIRVAGRFTAIHAGWYIDKKYVPDIEYYRNGCDPIISSTLRLMYDLIKEHHDIK